MQKLPKDKLLTLVVDERTSQRSLRQNRALWALLSEIAYQENNRKDKTLVDDLYKEMIVEANIHVSYMKVDIAKIRHIARCIQSCGHIRNVEHNGISYISCNLYKGSSNFDTKEMTDFIEVVLERGSRYDINILYYEDELK
ncbi:recombination protein NinB [Erysipelothrix sp. D19-032]